MAAVGAEVTTLGVVSFLLLLLLFLLLSIFLTALCSDCSRRSFELQDSEVDKDPSALIRVVKLEEVGVERENPMIGDIQNDEKELNPGEGNMASSFPSWRSHLEAPQSHQDVQTNVSAAVMKTGSDCETAAEGNPEEDNSVVPIPLWRSHLNPGEEHSDCSAACWDSMYARVSKKVRPTTEEEKEEEEEEEEGEESSPPLPDRTLEG